MEILILLLLSPAIFAQRYREHVSPNDEPFLPIHPVYPYNPKLTKRGFDKEIATVLKPELYAPRTDARDSYTASYAGNPKDAYFPGYGSSPYGSAPSHSPYSSYYGNNLYGGAYMNPYSSNPYTANPYSANSYTPGAHSSGSFPGYYHQPPYYYPDYYNQPFPYSFPPPDHSGPPGPPWNENPSSNHDYYSSKSEKPKPSKPKVKENSSSSSNGSQNQFVDGNNLISQNSKDLGTQSSAYKTSNPYNQLEQTAELQFKNVPIPPTTYKVISVGGQLVGPNYPLPSTYARAQLLEQATAVKNLAKSLGHLLPYQMAGIQGPQGTSSYLPDANAALGRPSFSGRPDQEKFYSFEQNPTGKIQAGQYYSENLGSPGKSVGANIYGSEERDLPDKESNDQFVTINQDSSGKLSAIQVHGDRNNIQNNAATEYAIGQADKGLKIFSQSSGTPVKSPSKYQSLPYIQKPGTTVTFQRSQSTYIPPSKIAQVPEEADSSSYDQPSSLSDSVPYKSDQNYRQDQMQSMIPYQNIGQGTPQAYTYHQTNILPLQQQQQHKTNLEDVNFGAKQGNKG